MVEILENPSVKQLIEATECTLMHYNNEELGISLDLQVPSDKEVENYRRKWPDLFFRELYHWKTQ